LPVTLDRRACAVPWAPLGLLETRGLSDLLGQTDQSGWPESAAPRETLGLLGHQVLWASLDRMDHRGPRGRKGIAGPMDH
jgi:hypothetical protein